MSRKSNYTNAIILDGKSYNLTLLCGVDFMIIRLGKFEATIFCSLIIFVSFIGAISYENKSTATIAQTQSVKLPIIMYHHITEDENKAGKYTVTTDEFENDLENIVSKGYTAVTVQELIDYVKHGKSLPEKPIMITFDDGFESFYYLAFPLLKEHNMKSVVSVIGSVTEKYSKINDHNINYSNLTFDEINELKSSALVEIQNHSYDMHNNSTDKRKGISKLKNETNKEYSYNLNNDLNKMQEILWNNCEIKPTAVAYPYGAYSKDTLEIVKSCGFECTMLCEERINLITQGNTESLYNLGRYNRPSGVSTEVFFKNILEN